MDENSLFKSNINKKNLENDEKIINRNVIYPSCRLIHWFYGRFVLGI